ncbi:MULTISPECIES: hypothetical protein [unclassified Amycolatopsis]|uniref:hypothetical protein n=1 Tax=unclassified Amycolatopsis TaxID=2618356 RepID=UPI00287536BA|nr:MULTISPECIES: hypothetical protein [unclassified Amycolatopsis]MDS0140623.1 hypothetical protein [Amycolatopsis sp. 505]MDS0149273.1 hypothetical protein [Amycolatopsis sp. CM201R]
MTSSSNGSSAPTTGPDPAKKSRDPTVGIDRDLYDRLKGAVLLMRGRGDGRYTVTRAVGEAVEALITRIETEYNNGEPVQPDHSPLPPGAPPGRTA